MQDERKESKLLDARRQTSVKNETNPGHLHPTNSLFDKNYIPNGTEQLHQEWQDQRESLILMAETISTSIRKGFNMPKCDYLMFNGNPMNYPRFIENFRINIEDREPSSRVRLAYLIQLRTPKRTPKEASFATRGKWNTLNCYYCKKPGHVVEECYLFRNQNFEARKDVVHKERLCNVCLCKGHFANQCRRKEH